MRSYLQIQPDPVASDIGGSLLHALIFLVVINLCGLPFSANASTGSERLNAFFDHLRGLQATFEQTVTDASGKVIQQARGTFDLARPGRFRWDYQSPYQQQIVADGDKIWVFDVDLEQVTVNPQHKAIGDTPALLLSSVEPLEKSFSIREIGIKNGIDWVELTPREQDTSFIVMRLGFDSDQIRMMELVDSFDQTTLLKFDNVIRNPQLDEAKFTFVPPEGVDVVSDIQD